MKRPFVTWRLDPRVSRFGTPRERLPLVVISEPGPSPCGPASQPGSLYETHVLPESSSQTRALSGRSIPMVWIDCNQRRPASCIGEDQERDRSQRKSGLRGTCSQGRYVQTPSFPLALTSDSSLFIVSFGPMLLGYA